MPRSAAAIKFAVRKLIAGREREKEPGWRPPTIYTATTTTTTTMALQIFITF